MRAHFPPSPQATVNGKCYRGILIDSDRVHDVLSQGRPMVYSLYFGLHLFTSSFDVCIYAYIYVYIYVCVYFAVYLSKSYVYLMCTGNVQGFRELVERIDVPVMPRYVWETGAGTIKKRPRERFVIVVKKQCCV